MKLKIELVSKKNVNSCIRLIIKVFNSDPWNDRWTEEKANKLFQDFLKTPGYLGYMGLVDNEVVSVCIGHIKMWWNSKEFYIEEYYVASKKQKNGVGTLFLREIEKKLEAQDVKNITLLTARNTLAESFYLKNGFLNLDHMTFMKKSM